MSLMRLNILLANQVLNFFVMAEHDNYHVSCMTKMQNNPQNKQGHLLSSRNERPNISTIVSDG